MRVSGGDPDSEGAVRYQLVTRPDPTRPDTTRAGPMNLPGAAPIVLAREYLKVYGAARLRESIGTQANTTCASSDHLRLLRRGLLRIQYRRILVDGCLAEPASP